MTGLGSGTGGSADACGAGSGACSGAGVISGMLGIGSGALKVLAMDQAMRLPFKVSTTTSNFSTDSVDATRFDVPAGFKKVESEMSKALR